jgi:dipeptidase D
MMSAEVPGLVQTSLNLGQVYTDGDSVVARFMIRSSVNSQAAETTEKVITLTRALGGAVDIPASYSAWQYRPDSHLRDVMVEAFRAVYNEEPKIAALHAGLECGILSGKMPELDCISFGPDLTNIHTPRERLHVASTERTWRLTLETLKRLK